MKTKLGPRKAAGKNVRRQLVQCRFEPPLRFRPVIRHDRKLQKASH